MLSEQDGTVACLQLKHSSSAILCHVVLEAYPPQAASPRSCHCLGGEGRCCQDRGLRALRGEGGRGRGSRVAVGRAGRKWFLLLGFWNGLSFRHMDVLLGLGRAVVSLSSLREWSLQSGKQEARLLCRHRCQRSSGASWLPAVCAAHPEATHSPCMC